MAPHSREETAEPNQRVSEIRGVIGACLGDQTLTGAKLLNSLDPPLFGLGDQPKQHMSESFEPPIRRRRCPKHSKSCVCAAFCRDDVTGLDIEPRQLDFGSLNLHRIPAKAMLLDRFSSGEERCCTR